MKEDKSTILLIDDEPECLIWLQEFFENKGYTVQHARNLPTALNKLDQRRYRLVVCDLGIPPGLELEEKLKEAGHAYVEFPGLFAAHHARNRGHRNRQVVVYSVHDTPSIREIANVVGVRHITKGHPKVIKREIDDILQYDPTDNRKRD